MAKIPFSLVFVLVVSVALHSVLCDDNPWQSVLEQAKSEASKAGFSDETIFGAEKAVADGSAQKAAEEALNDGSFNDWVQQAGILANEESSSSDAAKSLADDEDEDNFLGELQFAPKRSPSEAPSEAPTEATSEEPSEEPSEAPEAESPSAE